MHQRSRPRSRFRVRRDPQPERIGSARSHASSALAPVRVLGLAIVILLASLSASNAVVDHAASVEADWRWLGAVGARGGRARALAEGPAGDLAVGDSAGVSWWRGGSRTRVVLPPVRDLAFGPADTLWIATEEGLYFWPRGARPRHRALRGGDASNRIHRLLIVGTAMLLTTDGGAYWSSNGRIFQRLQAGGAATPVLRGALRLESAGVIGAVDGAPMAEIWLFGGGHLWRVRGRPTPSGLRVIDHQRLPLPHVLGDRLPVDLVLAPDGRWLHLVFDDVLSRVALERSSAAVFAGPWQTLRPSRPAGALLRRLVWAAGRVFLASDHGLLEAATLAGPFVRVSSSAGTSDCVDVASSRAYAALALCGRGLFALTPVEATSAAALAIRSPELAAPRPTASPLPPDPPVVEIRRRALLRSGLDVARDERLRRGLWQRAFWPEVLVRFAAEVDRDRRRDSDQSFLSGGTRHLLDRSRDEGHGFEASLVLDWELGGVAFPEDAVDLSREQRQVVSLRDDIADEINQLYFERQGIRERLATPGAVQSPEELDRLLRRAREIDAGLDAWTGGWISRWRLDAAVGAGAGRGDSEGSRHPESSIERNEE